jgi:uncharacterized SAM-binding protein YcdF (DUF218 family)
MTGDSRFWILFGGIWLVVGVAFLAATAGVNLFADPNQLDGAPPWIFALAGVAAILFGGFILRRTLIASARERRLMQSGIPISATVTDVRRSLVEINRQTRWYVCYRYDYDGRTLTGESGNMPGDMVMDFKPGGRVRIKVDPQKPEESLFVGKA